MCAFNLPVASQYCGKAVIHTPCPLVMRPRCLHQRTAPHARAQVFPHEYRRALDDAAKVALAQSQERELLDQASSMPHGLEGAVAPSGGSALAGLGLG